MAQKANTTNSKAATKYDIKKLRQNCNALFGVSTTVFDGATYGLEGEFTVEEIKTKITKWKSKEVK